MKTTTNNGTEIYIENPKDLRLTILNLLCKLEKESVGYGSDNAQMVIQFKEKDGKQWKMFIYYDFTEDNDMEEPGYVYSFHDEEHNDTLYTGFASRAGIYLRIMKEIHEQGLEWLAVDYGYAA